MVGDVEESISSKGAGPTGDLLWVEDVSEHALGRGKTTQERGSKEVLKT